MFTGKKLGELLIEKSYVDNASLENAVNQQKVRNCRIGQALVDLGCVTHTQLNETLSEQAGIAIADLESMDISPDLIGLVPADMVSKYNILPISQNGNELTLAMVDPFDMQAIADLRLVTGCSIIRRYGNPVEMERAIQKFYGSNVARMLDHLNPDQTTESESDLSEEDISAAKLHELAREPSLVNLVNLILLEAIEAKASDIHIEPFEKQVRIKYRVDGVLTEKSTSPKKLQAAIISRIKIMADMNIAERFVPQDGHIEFMGKSGKVDIRVSTVPTVFGESIVMRILDRSAALISLDDLGMSQATLKGFQQCLTKSHGIVLVTGPTGSGKTTSLYASLNRIYSPSLKIITIEDPVEYQLDGIIQMPVNPRRGLTFGKGLRHILRQDPDVIMVGEIRDKETADIAIRAALTGHLVFSTLHTNDAAGAITRLIDMGVEPFLLASSLEGVIAQRLVRRICPACKTQYNPEDTILRGLDNSVQVSRTTPIYHGTGCSECNNTGMSGRIGIYELIKITEQMRKLIASNPTAEQIIQAAPADHVSMRHDGIDKMFRGITTPEEVLRVTQGIEEE